MSFFAKTRRSYGTPTVYTLRADRLHGFGPPADDITTAARADNLWRDGENTVRRPAAVYVETLPVTGQVQWTQRFAGHPLILVQRDGTYYLYETDYAAQRNLGTRRPDRFFVKDKMLLLCQNEWLIFAADGTVTAFCSGGAADINGVSAWSQPGAYHWSYETSLAPIPLIRAGSAPSGGGDPMQSVNMLCPYVCESYRYTAQDAAAKRNRFCMSLTPQLSGPMPFDQNGTTADLTDGEKTQRTQTMTDAAYLEVRLKKTDEAGNELSVWQARPWQYKDNINTADAAFWVQGADALALSQDGADNIRITYRRKQSEFESDFAKILDCGVHTMFGVGGAKDRIFLSGNPAEKGRIRYSEMDQPFYFGALQYLDIGNGRTICLMSGRPQKMAVMSEEGTFQVTGTAQSAEKGGYVLDACFTVSACLPSPAPIGTGQTVIAGDEVVYLSRRGICALAPSGIMDERNVQIRSRRAEALLQSEDLADAYLTVWNDWLILVCGDHLYLFDTNRKVSVRNDVYTDFAYEAYRWTNLSATGLCAADSGLTFFVGNERYVFREDRYSDEIRQNGQTIKRPIHVLWQSHPLDGKGHEQCSRFFSITPVTGAPCALKIGVRDERGGWETVHDYNAAFLRFAYAEIRYGLWNYNTVARDAVRLPLPLRHRRCLSLRLENNLPDQPFSLTGMIMEYK